MIQTELWTTSRLLTATKGFAILFRVVAVVVLSLALTTGAVAQEILIQEGFEAHALEEFNGFWEGFLGLEITSDLAKTGKKSLAIFGNTLIDTYSMPIDTDASIISVEFWVYIEEGGRSFSFKVASDDESFDNAGPDIGWDKRFVYFYAHERWQEIGKFETDKWKYVRIVANFDKSVFDFYSGDNRFKALRAKPESRIPFRRDAAGPATRIVFHIKTMDAPAYVDSLLVYEGGNPIALAVEPKRKLATMWGHLKRQ